MIPTSQKGPSISSGSFDPEALLELLEKATSGLGDVARSVDAMLVKLVDWIRSIDTSSLIEQFGSDMSVERIQAWHDVVAQAQSYEARIHDLRHLQSIEAATGHMSSMPPSIDEQSIVALRAQLLASIPDSIWSDAIEGFGDSDLANL